MNSPLRRRVITGATAGAALLLALTACGGKAATPTVLSSSAPAPASTSAEPEPTAGDAFNPPRPSGFADDQWASFLADFPSGDLTDPDWVWNCGGLQTVRDNGSDLAAAVQAGVTAGAGTEEELTALFTYVADYIEPACTDYPYIDDTFAPVKPDALTDEQWAEVLATFPSGDRVNDPAWQDVCAAFGGTTGRAAWIAALDTYGQDLVPGSTPDDWRAFLSYLRNYLRPVCAASETPPADTADPAAWTSVCDSDATYCVTSDSAEQTFTLTGSETIVVDMPGISSVDCPGTGQVYTYFNTSEDADGPAWYSLYTYDEAGVAGENTCTVTASDGSEFSFYVSVLDPQ